MLQHNYCLAISLPPEKHLEADMGLAALMVSAPLWVSSLNQYIALAGGIMGIILAATRIWKLFRGKE